MLLSARVRTGGLGVLVLGSVTTSIGLRLPPHHLLKGAVEPRFVIGEFLDCLCWNAEFFAETDIRSDHICILMSVPTGTLEHIPVCSF